MILFAIDCDGTVSASNGPVPVEAVMALAVRHHVWIIGNKALCTITGLPCVGIMKGIFVSGLEYPGGKTQALIDLKARIPDAEKYIVVDDQPGQYLGGIPDGWEFLSPQEFLARLTIIPKG